MVEFCLKKKLSKIEILDTNNDFNNYTEKFDMLCVEIKL